MVIDLKVVTRSYLRSFTSTYNMRRLAFDDPYFDTGRSLTTIIETTYYLPALRYLLT